MQKTINELVQLQELMIARAQQAATMPGTRFTQLDNSAKAMLKELPADLASHFRKLQKRGPLSIVPISQPVCTGCGMSIPVSLLQEVRKQEKILQCPNCAVMLYYSDNAPRAKSRRPRRGEPPKVGIERFSAPELMIPRLSATTRDDAIAEMCSKMEEEGFIDNSKRLTEAALKREAIASTAVDHGIAFPHVRGVEGGGLSLVLGLSKKGIKFGHPGGKFTRIIFFMLIPTAVSAFYLKLLSGLTQTFREKDARDKLMVPEKPEALWKVLVKTTRSKVT